MKKKPEIKRFLINNRVSYVVWALLLVPVLVLFSKRTSVTEHFYQFAMPAALIAILAALSCGKPSKNKNRGVFGRRYKYRYMFVVVLIFLHNTLYALLDYYYYNEDYLKEIVFASIFYSLLCSPVIITRTAYSRELDLLDYFYRNREDGIFSLIITIVILFYTTIFALLFIGNYLGLNKKIFSVDDVYGLTLIVPVVIEIIILSIVHIILCRKELKRYGKIDYK